MLTVRVLGELALELDGVPFDLPARRARSLVGLLALDRRLHARSDLAARFWPDVLDESARTSLRSALASLRRPLGPDGDRYLVATREHVGLRGDIWTDAEAFTELVAADRLQEATELYRGDLLAGLDDDWIAGPRDEWRERAADVLARLAATAEATADWPTAIAYTRRIVALDPLAEEGQRALIRRLAQAGDRPAALAAYARYADRLRTELRIAPSAATRAVVDDLRRAEPEPEPETEAVPVAVTTAVAPRPASASGTVTLLFTDLVGSTELLGELGEDGAERLRRDHFGLLRDVALAHGGQEVKSLGDGLMVAFGSSTDAAACAIGIQQAVARHNQRVGNEHMRVRVGLNVGEPIREEDDYFGTPVVVAKRLCDQADGGQILASELVRLLIGGRGDFTFRSVGELALKGLTQPVAACEIAWSPVGTQRIALPRELARDQGTLVGRADELATLQQAWLRSCDGRLGVVMVAGEPGIGKTRLVAEFCRRAQDDGATVLLGRCHEETAAPYEPFVEALRHYVTACPVDELRFQIGNRRKVLSKLVPELDGAHDDEGPAAGDMSDRDAGERFALLDAVGSLVCEAALTHPTILVLDDLQWADDASLLLIRHVARAAVDVPLLIVGTYRETELHADDALSAVLAELRRARAVEVLPLRGLEAADVAVLIRGLGADLPHAGADAVAQRTEGNPFFIEEMVRHLDAGGELGLPESVKDLVRRRLQGLGDPASRAIRAAAVLGREFDLSALERMVDADGDDLLEALDEALATSVLVEVSDAVARFAFSHALIRETVYEQLSTARRARLHLRAGTALEQLHGRQLDDHAEQLAHHFVLAGDAEKSFEYQLRAARAAARVYALEAAIVHQSAALETAAQLGLSAEVDERVRRLLLERGSSRHRQGDHEASLADFGQCLAAARTVGDRRLQAEALDNLAFAEKPFDVERSSAHHDEALVIAQELGDAPLQISILGRMSLSRANNLDLAGALEAGERALELAEGTGGDDDRKIAIDALKLVALQLGDLERLGALTAELEDVERRQGDLWYLQWTLLESSFVPIAHAQWERATARLHEALAIHGRVGDAFAEPVLHDALCWLERSRGDYGAALAQGREAVQLTEGDRPGPFSAWTRATLGWALLDASAIDEAVPVLERGRDDATTLNDRFRVCGHLAWAYMLAGERAQGDAAADEAEAALARLTIPAGGAFVYGFGAATALARAHLAAGRPQRGAVVLEPLLAAAERSGWQEATASVALVLGLCHAANDDAPAARALVRRAVDLAAEHALPGIEWEASRVLAGLSSGAEATDLRARSAAVVQELAAGLGDDRLAAAFVLAAER
jgi:class 3 adenylate cyclase